MGYQTGEVTNLYPETVHLSAGATLVIPALPGQAQVDVKYVSGGSLLIVGALSATYALGVSNLYLFSTTEIKTFYGHGQFALQATGATVVAHIIRYTFGTTLV